MSLKMKTKSADDLGDDYVAGSASDAEQHERTESPSKALGKRKRQENVAGRPRTSTKRPKTGAVEIAQEALDVAHSPAAVQVDYLKRQHERAFPTQSQLEKDDFVILESYIADTSAVPLEGRKTLASFLGSAFPEVTKTLQKQSKKKGSPRVIVVCAAALRVADLCRDIRSLTAQGEVAKLFAKHMKLADQIKYCNNNAFSVAISVPDRLGKLINEPDSLSLDSVAHLVLDVSHIDSKQRSLLDHKEASQAFFKTVLRHPKIQDKLKAERLKIVMF